MIQEIKTDGWAEVGTVSNAKPSWNRFRRASNKSQLAPVVNNYIGELSRSTIYLGTAVLRAALIYSKAPTVDSAPPTEQDAK